MMKGGGEEWKDREKEKMNRWGVGWEVRVYGDRRMLFLMNLDVFVQLLCEMFYGRE